LRENLGEEKEQPLETNTKKAVIYRVVLLLLNFGYNATVKISTNEKVEEWDLLWVRSVVTLIYLFAFMKFKGIKFCGAPELRQSARLITINSIFGTIAFPSLVFALARCPLSVVTIIKST